MKVFLKILGISLLATLVYIIGSSLLPFSEPFKEAGKNSNPLIILYFIIVNLWFTYTVYFIGKNSDWIKYRLIYSLLFVFFFVYCFMTQIETLFFGFAFEKLSKLDGWIIMLANFIPLLVIVPLTLIIVKRSNTEKNNTIRIKLSTIFWKVGVLAIVYVFVYFIFGHFIAWQFADLREFYSDTTEKLPFIQQMKANFQNSGIVPFQLLRGILFSSFILPIVFMLKSKQLLIGLILIYFSTAIGLIIPNFLFPDTVRWAHFLEMSTSMTFYAFITWLVWRKR